MSKPKLFPDGIAIPSSTDYLADVDQFLRGQIHRGRNRSVDHRRRCHRRIRTGSITPSSMETAPTFPGRSEVRFSISAAEVRVTGCVTRERIRLTSVRNPSTTTIFSRKSDGVCSSYGIRGRCQRHAGTVGRHLRGNRPKNYRGIPRRQNMSTAQLIFAVIYFALGVGLIFLAILIIRDSARLRLNRVPPPCSFLAGWVRFSPPWERLFPAIKPPRPEGILPVQSFLYLGAVLSRPPVFLLGISPRSPARSASTVAAFDLCSSLFSRHPAGLLLQSPIAS